MMPCLELRLMPEMTAIGAARISGQGVATTKTSREADDVPAQQPRANSDGERHNGEGNAVADRPGGQSAIVPVPADCTSLMICSNWLSAAARSARAVMAHV